MGDFQRINADRPGKIVHMLETIQKSAKSNRASEEEIKALLGPVFAALGDMGFLAGATPHQEPQKAPEPRLSGSLSRDKQDIREVLMELTATQKRLTNIVLGWPVEPK